MGFVGVSVGISVWGAVGVSVGESVRESVGGAVGVLKVASKLLLNFAWASVQVISCNSHLCKTVLCLMPQLSTPCAKFPGTTQSIVPMNSTLSTDFVVLFISHKHSKELICQKNLATHAEIIKLLNDDVSCYSENQIIANFMLPPCSLYPWTKFTTLVWHPRVKTYQWSGWTLLFQEYQYLLNVQESH